MKSTLTMGPVLFHWPAEQKRDFYFRVADEAPVDMVYIGEVICSKRAPFFEKYYDVVADRLQRAGKTVIFSSLAEVMIQRERKMTAGLCELEDFDVEANDTSALYHLRGKRHRIGQYFNVYNEETLAYLAQRGAFHMTLPAELPQPALAVLAEKARQHDVSLEVQVFGRVGLALSARCYHARAHGRIKDNCQFVCEEDPDGMPLKTLGNKDFLCVNGVQTLSYTCLNLIHEIRQMQDMGIGYFRLSPHTQDMVKVATTFHKVLTGEKTPEAGLKILAQDNFGATYSNGFYHGKEGYIWQPPSA